MSRRTGDRLSRLLAEPVIPTFPCSFSEGIWCAVLSKRYIKVLLFIRPISGWFSAGLSVEFSYFPHAPHQFFGRSALPDVPEKGRSPESMLLYRGQVFRPDAAARCDAWVKIPLPGQAESLNASVAAGVLLYEVVRQRLPK